MWQVVSVNGVWVIPVRAEKLTRWDSTYFTDTTVSVKRTLTTRSICGITKKKSIKTDVIRKMPYTNMRWNSSKTIRTRHFSVISHIRFPMPNCVSRKTVSSICIKVNFKSPTRGTTTEIMVQQLIPAHNLRLWLPDWTRMWDKSSINWKSWVSPKRLYLYSRAITALITREEQIRLSSTQRNDWEDWNELCTRAVCACLISPIGRGLSKPAL